MHRIVLVSAPITIKERYGKLSSAGSTQSTYALPCLAAIVKQNGMEVYLIDASAFGLTVEATLKKVVEYNPSVVGFTATTVGITASADLAKRIKQINSRILTIIGGPHITSIPVETMSEFDGFDIGVLGEGELTFAEILAEIKKSVTVPNNLLGTVVRRDGKIQLNPPRQQINNLDELPFPYWEGLPNFPHAFIPSPGRIKRFPCAAVVLTRGCPNQCCFCDRSVFGHRVRSFSPAYAINMIKDLRENFGVKEVLLEDDTFIISKSRVTEFCERLVAEKIDITWSCLGRADRVDFTLLKLLKRAGCWHISYGIESGDQKILNAMHKNETLSQIEDAIKWTKEAKIKCKGFFMVGFPGETYDSIKLTREFALRLPLDDISVMQLTPFPGTAIFNRANDYGTFERDWRKMNVINTVFVPHGFTVADIEKTRSIILKQFYFRPRIVLNKLIDIIINPRLFWYMLKGLVALIKVTN